MKTVLRLSVVVAALTCLALRAPAQITSYSDRTTFLAAAGATTSIDFEGLAPVNNFSFFSSPPGLTISGVNFSSPDNLLFVIDPGYSSPFFFWNSGQYLQNNFGGALTINLPVGVKAFGFDLSASFLSDETVNVDGTDFTVPQPGQPDYTFIGFTSLTDISVITVIDPLAFNGGVPTIDNVAFTTLAAVPEPGSLAALAGMSVIVIPAVASRCRRRTAK